MPFQSMVLSEIRAIAWQFGVYWIMMFLAFPEVVDHLLVPNQISQSDRGGRFLDPAFKRPCNILYVQEI